MAYTSPTQSNGERWAIMLEGPEGAHSLGDARKRYVYTLSDPAFPGVVFYVGMTVNPERRYSMHCANDRARKHTERGAWLAHLRQQGRRPMMRIVLTATCSERRGLRFERYAMFEYWVEGHPLTNTELRDILLGWRWRNFYGLA